MIRVGVVGASGYGGLELIRTLLGHSAVALVRLFGSASIGKLVHDVHPSLRHCTALRIEGFDASALKGLDLLFLSLPSGESMSYVPDALNAGCRVIDLGGDFRLPDGDLYERYYRHQHTQPALLRQSVYGLPEWNAPAIASAALVANPGCYPTSILLPLLPLLRKGLLETSHIGITSYSGTSGAGKSVAANLMFSEVNESVRAYRVGDHQHIPEINHYLEKFSARQASFTFVPHVFPATRGIYTTVHATTPQGVTMTTLGEAFQEHYGNSPFVRIRGTQPPEMQHVTNTNFCDIGFLLDEDKHHLVILSTLDNLGKGAAGQAVQNLNVMFGLPQTEGLLSCFKKS